MESCDMTTDPSKLHYTSAGFWLPCYQSSFFSHEERDGDRDVLEPSYRFTGDQAWGDFSAPPNLRLETSIYRRLLMVLPLKGYTLAIPLYSSRRRDHTRDKADPNAILYASTSMDKTPGFSNDS